MKKDKKVRHIDCKKIEKQIPMYLDNKLSAHEMLILLDHIKQCKNCREELTIEYMVSEGLDRVELENDYDLLQGLEDRINESYTQIKAHDFIYFGFVFCLLCIACIVGVAIFTIIM